MPKDRRKLGRRPLRALGEPTQHNPGSLGKLDEKGTPPLPHQRGNAIHKRLPIVGLTLVKHSPHVDVGVAKFGVQRLRLALLCGIDQAVRRLPRPIRPPSMIKGSSREIGPDNVRVPIGKKPRLGPVTTPEIHKRQPRSGQVQFEQR
ncbi:hypothetical protein GCM10010307_74240 [Streptomyces vastus]|uniref:Uncharacterized protein n=1 Tax=Streptomyces vastus TaxID=285451 RepID=A0ABN3RR24_9ACTN